MSSTTRAAIAIIILVVAYVATQGDRMGSISPEERFWTWFQSNEGQLFVLTENSSPLLDQIAIQLKRVHSSLTFELGPQEPPGPRDFIVSAGGDRLAFPAVEKLCKRAPTLNRWRWIKFRPRRATISDINYGGKIVKADDVHYVMCKDGDKVGLVLFFDGYSKHSEETFGQIGYLLLDEAIGEYPMETKVGFVEFHSRQSEIFPRALPLRGLPAQFDAYWAQKRE